MARIVIPKRFDLMGRTFKVTFTDGLVEDEDDPRGIGLLGKCNHDGGEIKISRKQARDSQEHTYFHELEHAVLSAMGKRALNKDEDFVDLHSGLWLQAMKTARN